MRLILTILHAVFLCGFTPRRIARANRNVPLWRAYLAHWIGLVVTCCVIVALYSLDRTGAGDLLYLWDSALEAGASAMLIGGAVLVSIELAFVLAALLLLPWGDARAAVGTVWRHALRTVWLHTGHLAWAVGCCVLAHVVCHTWLRDWYNSYSLTIPPPPRASVVILKWLTMNYEYVLPLIFAAAGAWCVWALFRAATIELPPPVARSPMCEACGYNLSYHREPSARCPECGRPVALSLGENLRQPVPWGPFAMANRHTGFFGAAQRAWFGPEPFFMGVPAYTGLWSAGRFLLVQLILTALAFTAAMTLGVGCILGELSWYDLPEFLYFCGVASSIVSLLSGIGVCLAAAVIGLIVSKQEGRNCLGGTLRVACFCAGIVPVWVFCQVMAVFVAGKIIESLLPRLFFVFPLAFFGLTVLLAVLYTGGVARRVRYLRYANT